MKAIALATLLGACGTTGGSLATFDVAASGTGARSFDTATGWHVDLSTAQLHIGAVFLNLAVPISGSQETNCILPGIYTAQELSALDVDVLSSDRQLFPAPGTGTDDVARTGEIWLTGGDINAETDTTQIARLAGTATKNGAVVPFTAGVTISFANRGIPQSDPALPSQHPICKQRIVSPIPIELDPTDGGTLVIQVDPKPWITNIDFGALTPDGVIPDTNTDPASQSLFTGMRAAAATFQLSFE
ncbi:MAG TPA: hypothetical protein VGM90_29360 [Kofleriaceae bacterium]|jgi:hypothetical protein